jgi:polysaccharide export outer membrane protein
MMAIRMIFKPQLTTSKQKGNRNPSRRLALTVSGLVAALLLMQYPLAAQTRDHVKEQAESQLQRMTPEEIDQKLKELGISREEATARAHDYGISLEDYLFSSRRTASQDVRPVTPTFTDPRLATIRAVQSSRARDSLLALLNVPVPRKRVEVPGFVGRRGIDTLIQPFGFNLFQYSPSTFLPSGTVATPPSYALGPGDEVLITLWGETRLNYQLTVNRDGNIVVPDVGPVAANGLTLTQFKEKVLRRMTSVYSSLRGGAANAATFMDVSLGKLRNIEVYVLGEVSRPGGYSVPSMSTVLTAMYMAGGPTVDGTMREIRQLREGDTVQTIDLYDYILKGDRSGDRALQDGDVVFVDPGGKRAAVVGLVVRPAIYELKSGETLGSLLTFSGGPRFNAYINRVHVERIVPFDRRSLYARDIEDFDVTFSSLAQLERSNAGVENGDIVTVMGIGTMAANRVSVTGSVRKPGPFEFKEGMTVRDLVMAADSLRENTFADRASLFRMQPNRRREVRSVNLRLAVAEDASENMPLQNEDSLVVFNIDEFFPRDSVMVRGAVRMPGVYLRYDSMTVADLVVAAGGLTEDASTKSWELSRIDTTRLGVYSRIFKLDAPREYWNSTGSLDLLLKPRDVLFIPGEPKYVPQKLVAVNGSVMFPGVYALRYEKERLASILDRAGGLREGAYLEGSRLIRKFNNAGLVPLDFESAFKDTNSRDNIVMYDGDSIYVAYTEDVIYVSGEVIVPSPVLYKKGANPSYYISQAGGFKEEADEGRTVTLLPGGKKWEPSGWFFIPDDEVLPGSTVYVPRKRPQEDKTLPILMNTLAIIASIAAITVSVVTVSKL